MSRPGEFDIIARHFAPLSRTLAGAFNLTDDAAQLETPRGKAWVVTADAIVAGVHFLPDDPPRTIAQKLLRVNLSDLAAKGAVPHSYVLTAAFAKGTAEPWIADFAKGLKADQKTFGIALMGGDTVVTPGPMSFSVTMFGLTPAGRMVRRHGAKPGDRLYVSGTIGDGGFGLAELQQPHTGLKPAHRRFLIDRYRLPQPRVALAPVVQRHAGAALDVSDGLVQDLGHIADVSGVRLVLNVDQVPLSRAGVAIAAADRGARNRAIAAGDDYEIAFTVPDARIRAFERDAEASGVAVSVIGHVAKGRGVICLDRYGDEIVLGAGGYNHFSPR